MSSNSEMTKGADSATLIHAEDLEEQVRQLIGMARREGEAIRKSNQARTGKVYRRIDTPNIDDLLIEDLMLELEDEIISAVATSPTGGILPRDLNHELMKKALVGLKAPALRRLAQSVHLPTTGRMESVATRIAEHYAWDSEQIARAILEAEGRLQPTTTHGHHDRLVPLETEPDLNYVIDRLNFVIGRYIRTGVARWFVFDRLDGDREHLQLSGSVQTYRAFVDETGDTPTVGASPSERHVDISLDAGSAIARVRRGSAFDAKTAMDALTIGSNNSVRRAGFVPMRSIRGLGPWTLTIDRVTLFMLDLLNARLREQGLRGFDMKVARFRLSESGANEEEEVQAPSLEAVRFEGRHILDSTEACRLIASEGRSLVGLSLSAMVARRPGEEDARFPLHVALDDWSVALTTGFGSTLPELSVSAHQALIEAVTSEIRDGVSDVESLNSLAERITDRATSPSIPERADLWADPADT